MGKASMYGHCPGAKIDLPEHLTTEERRQPLTTALGTSVEAVDGILARIDEYERAHDLDGDTDTTLG